MPRPTTADVTGWIDPSTRPRLFHCWLPVANPRAVAVFVHGFGEHCGRYENAYAALRAHDIACVGFDQRGHGRSDGRRTHVRRFDDFLADTAAAIALARDRAPGQPLFLLGHSLGGLIAAEFARSARGPIDGLILSSPALAFAVRVPRWKHWVGCAASALLPAVRLPSDAPTDKLSRDPEVGRSARADPLMVFSATARWYTECLAAQRRVRAGADTIETPTLLLVAGADALVDPGAQVDFFAALGAVDKTCDTDPDAYHERFHELDAAAVLARVADWVTARAERSVRSPS